MTLTRREGELEKSSGATAAHKEEQIDLRPVDMRLHQAIETLNFTNLIDAIGKDADPFVKVAGLTPLEFVKLEMLKASTRRDSGDEILGNGLRLEILDDMGKALMDYERSYTISRAQGRPTRLRL